MCFYLGSISQSKILREKNIYLYDIDVEMFVKKISSSFVIYTCNFTTFFTHSLLVLGAFNRSYQYVLIEIYKVKFILVKSRNNLKMMV